MPSDHLPSIRLGDRLRVTWAIAPETPNARVPSLLLQPLVENAIQHAIAPASAGGTLLIRARREGDTLQLEVRDSGPGLPVNSAAGSRTGVGLANTRNRLQRLYGERQRFELVTDGGLTVVVRIPFVAVTPQGESRDAS